MRLKETHSIRHKRRMFINGNRALWHQAPIRILLLKNMKTCVHNTGHGFKINHEHTSAVARRGISVPPRAQPHRSLNKAMNVIQYSLTSLFEYYY